MHLTGIRRVFAKAAIIAVPAAAIIAPLLSSAEAPRNTFETSLIAAAAPDKGV